MHLTYSARSEELVVFQVKPNTQVAYAPRASDEFPQVLPLSAPYAVAGKGFAAGTDATSASLPLAGG